MIKCRPELFDNHAQHGQTLFAFPPVEINWAVCPVLLAFMIIHKGLFTYGRKSVDRIATQSMSKICNLWRLIVVDCDYAESNGRFLSGGNADAVYLVPDDS